MRPSSSESLSAMRTAGKSNAGSLNERRGLSLVNRVQQTSAAVLVVIVAMMLFGWMRGGRTKAHAIPERKWGNSSLALTTSQEEIRCCDVGRREVDSISQQEWMGKSRQPVVLLGVMDKWPARQWTPAQFMDEPFASHKISLTQHTALDVCLDQIQMAIEIAHKHGSNLPAEDATMLPPESHKVCETLFASLDAVEAVHEGSKQSPQMRSLIRSQVLNGTSPAYHLETTLGEFAAVLATKSHEYYGAYLFLESTIFERYPSLWEQNIQPLPAILDPAVDFYPKMSGTRGSQRSLLMGFQGSRTALHRDPWGETSWIAVISGRKAFRLWPPNATDCFYPVDGLHSGVHKTHVDSFAFIPKEAALLHTKACQPMELVAGPGEVVVTMDWWHQVYNLEAGIAVTGNFIDKAGVTNALKMAIAAENIEVATAILAKAHENDPATFEALRMLVPPLPWT